MEIFSQIQSGNILPNPKWKYSPKSKLFKDNLISSYL
nr:hypothetical protein pmam_398 [Pithovirus mammoth]